jgi:hypothetical protein
MTTGPFRPAFTEYIPPDPQPGVLYVSLTYATAVHLCACGCARKVVTPFSPADWQLTFDGTVTIYPSIGNWQYPCQSHYFIRSNQVIWAKHLPKDQITKSLQLDSEERQAYYGPVTNRNRIWQWLGSHLRPTRRKARIHGKGSTRA